MACSFFPGKKTILKLARALCLPLVTVYFSKDLFSVVEATNYFFWCQNKEVKALLRLFRIFGK